MRIGLEIPSFTGSGGAAGLRRDLAGIGVQHAIFDLPNVAESTPLEVFAREIIPEAAGF